jgi:hypothetical protein
MTTIIETPITKTNQYTNASAVKKFLEKKIHEQVSKAEMSNFSFDIIPGKDRENQDFLYISLVDNGNFVANNFNDELLEKLGSIIKKCIESHCSNLIEIVGIGEGASRQLLWLPKDKSCVTLYERYEEIDEFSVKPLTKKLKIK